MKSKKFILIFLVLVIAIVGFVYYSSKDKFEDLEKLGKQLPKNHIITKAQITKLDKVGTYTDLIHKTKHKNGFLYTYRFDATNGKNYMGNYFSKIKRFDINDSIPVIYLPDNPKVNEFYEK